MPERRNSIANALELRLPGTNPNDITLARQRKAKPCAYFMGYIVEFRHRDPDSKVHGANTGPIWGRQDPGGPHVGPMNFAIWRHNAKCGVVWCEWTYGCIFRLLFHNDILSNGNIHTMYMTPPVYAMYIVLFHDVINTSLDCCRGNVWLTFLSTSLYTLRPWQNSRHFAGDTLTHCPLWPLLLTWFNFNPSMDK